MQYLIRTLTDSTGHTFTHVTQARENETFTVVEAESKEKAEKMAKKPIITETNKSKVVSFDRTSEDTMESLFDKGYKIESGRLSPKQEKAPKPPRKDSE